MWEFFGIITSQLGSTFKWLFYGFILTIILIYVLRKNKLLIKKGFIGTLIVSLYYIVFPVIIGITTWFYVATKHVEHDANQLSDVVIESVEMAILPSFRNYITENIEKYTGLTEIPTNDEIVSGFLLEGEESGWLKKKLLHWTLVETLEYLEEKALEKAGETIGIENLNITALSLDKKALDVPFKYLKGKSKKTIHSFLGNYYIIYYTIYFLVFLILFIDIYFSYRKKNRLIDESHLLENDNLKIE
jgi:hypothetical protein